RNGIQHTRHRQRRWIQPGPPHAYESQGQRDGEPEQRRPQGHHQVIGEQLTEATQVPRNSEAHNCFRFDSARLRSSCCVRITAATCSPLITPSTPPSSSTATA